ncbi:MAG: hypothetical protein ACE15D_09145 [Candidatus Eisenbacteria bacterium]
MRRAGAGARIAAVLAVACSLPLAAASPSFAQEHAAAGGEAGIRLSAAAGIAYLHPRDTELSSLYDDPISFLAGLQAAIPNLGIRIGLDAGYARSTSPLDSPFFASSVESELTRVPIRLTVTAPFGSPNLPVRPFAGAGAEFLYHRETIRYRLLDEPASEKDESRFDPGAVILAGIESRGSPRLRLEGSASWVPVERNVVRGGATYPARLDDERDGGTLGVRMEILWP